MQMSIAAITALAGLGRDIYDERVRRGSEEG
jgi:hypothetical protein